jgi:predicted RNA-binding Zn ribbon-like protein
MQVPANKQTRGQGRTRDYPRLLSGRLCLDFANTIEGPISPEPEDFLVDYSALARWTWHARAIGDDQLRTLNERGAADLTTAADAFAEAMRTRETIDRIFRSIAVGGRPATRDLETLRETYLQAIRVASLLPGDHQFRWSWVDVEDLRLPTWLVAQDALDLLSRADLKRVKQCSGANQDCGWLFYDTSRNHTRRWCSMEGCGSRMKMRRLYARHRKASGDD